MSSAEVRRRLHEDPGVGWMIAGRTARFELTIEALPYHACAIRTMTAAGFPDLVPYRRLALRYENAHGRFVAMEAMDQIVGELHVRGGGERADLGGGRIDALFVALTDVDERHRSPGDTAVEVRFTHQMYVPPTH